MTQNKEWFAIKTITKSGSTTVIQKLDLKTIDKYLNCPIKLSVIKGRVFIYIVVDKTNN